MSREIKTKLWCHDYHEWEKHRYAILFDGSLVWLEPQIAFMRPVDMRHHTLVQYTGLKDKNDVEIYEGDYVKHINFYTPARIEYKGGAFYTGNILLDTYHNSLIEIVGNVFQNPELLEVNNDNE